MKGMNESNACPAGRICGYGTNLLRQVEHLTPAGTYSYESTVEEEQYKYPCPAGHYCGRGTTFYYQTRSKCSPGSFCPQGTSAVLPQVSCPEQTTSAAGEKYNIT